MNDEKLIELVREHTALYNLSDSKYMDPKYKMTIWEEIGRNLNTTGSVCKSRWINIRDQFRRHVGKPQTKSGQAAENKKKYKYEANLQFLLPYITERNTISNIISVGNEHSENFEPEGSVNSDPELAISQASTDPQPSTSNNQTLNPKKNAKRKYESCETPSSILMRYIIENNKNTKENESNEIDTFLASIGTTIKKFSPYYQHLAKGKIFNLVHNLEFQEIQSVQSSRSSYSPHNSVYSTPVDSPQTTNLTVGSPETQIVQEGSGAVSSINQYYKNFS